MARLLKEAGDIQKRLDDLKSQAEKRIDQQAYTNKPGRIEWGKLPADILKLWNDTISSNFIDICSDSEVSQTILSAATEARKEREQTARNKAIKIGSLAEKEFSRVCQRSQARWEALGKRIELMQKTFKLVEKGAFWILEGLDQSKLSSEERKEVLEPFMLENRYWTPDATQERLRILSKYSKYCNVTWKSIAVMGGLKHLLWELKTYGQHIMLVEFDEDVYIEEEDVGIVADCLSNIESLTSFIYPDSAIVQAIREHLPPQTRIMGTDHSWFVPENATPDPQQEGVYYKNVVITDLYRQGEPYLLFGKPSASCIINFSIAEAGDYVLPVKHCFTSGNGKIEIRLNNIPLDGRDWDLTKAVHDNFEVEEIKLPMLKAGSNTVTISWIGRDSEGGGVYWLSDIYLPPKFPKQH
ncbi:hypothetical protein C8J56DRAFT_948715 [Mycena floridula]|nr:hypothetical protein C8J56DRAFT_948715 [Mycena floridula]